MNDPESNQRITSVEELLRRDAFNVKLASISEYSFYSYRHTNRLFSKLMGESINGFTTKIRLQKAAEFLKYSARPIFDIAIDVGYESSASFNKAFKKIFRESPTNYRRIHKKHFDAFLHKSQDRPYHIDLLNDLGLVSKKVTCNPNAPVEEFDHILQAQFANIHIPSDSFLLLWDEDPEICPFDECRFFLASEDPKATGLEDVPPTIEGKYAIFHSEVFHDLDYNDWHRLAFLMLEWNQHDMRDGTYIEYYNGRDLWAVGLSQPTKIAIPIV